MKSNDQIKVTVGTNVFYVDRKKLWKKSKWDTEIDKDPTKNKQEISYGGGLLVVRPEYKQRQIGEDELNIQCMYDFYMASHLKRQAERGVPNNNIVINDVLRKAGDIQNYDDRQEFIKNPSYIHFDMQTGMLSSIKQDSKITFPQHIKHLTTQIRAHGDEERTFISYNFKEKKDLPIEGLVLDHMERIDDKDFQKLDSFYLKSGACHGAYHDTKTNIFDEIQKKLKKCSTNHPQCFVRLVKKDFVLIDSAFFDNHGNIHNFQPIPMSENPDKKVIYEELCKDKDKYFDYYYVTVSGVYKVPHKLVHDRIKLIKNGKFKEEFRKCAMNGKNFKKCFPRYDFKEFYQANKLYNSVRRNQPMSEKKIINQVKNNQVPAWLKDYY